MVNSFRKLNQNIKSSCRSIFSIHVLYQVNTKFVKELNINWSLTKPKPMQLPKISFKILDCTLLLFPTKEKRMEFQSFIQDIHIFIRLILQNKEKVVCYDGLHACHVMPERSWSVFNSLGMQRKTQHLCDDHQCDQSLSTSSALQSAETFTRNIYY